MSKTLVKYAKKTRESMHRHAHERAYQRYGINLKDTDLSEIINQIKEKRSKYLFNKCGNETHLVSLNEVTLKVCFNRYRKLLTTILPLRKKQTN